MSRDWVDLGLRVLIALAGVGLVISTVILIIALVEGA